MSGDSLDLEIALGYVAQFGTLMVDGIVNRTGFQPVPIRCAVHFVSDGDDFWYRVVPAKTTLDLSVCDGSGVGPQSYRMLDPCRGDGGSGADFPMDCAQMNGRMGGDRSAGSRLRSHPIPEGKCEYRPTASGQYGFWMIICKFPPEVVLCTLQGMLIKRLF